MNTRTNAIRLLAIAIPAGGLLLPAGGTQATLPISGNTLDFEAGIGLGTSDGRIHAVALGDLDGDGRLDAVTGSTSGEYFEVIA